jgi:hypothetical protein
VSGPRQFGRIRIGRRELTVRALDESAGGFLIEVDDSEGVHAGDTLLLELAGAWMEVRVVHLAVKPVEGDTAKPARINLARLRDVPEPEDDEEPWSWDRLRTMLVPLVPASRPVWATATTVVAIALVGLGVVLVLENLYPITDAMHAEARRKSIENEILRDALEPLADNAPPVPPAREAPSLGPSPTERPRGAKPSRSGPPAAEAEPQAADLAQSIAPEHKPADVPKPVLKLAQPDFLLRPEVAKLLALSDEQRAHLEALASEVRTGAESGAEQDGQPDAAVDAATDPTAHDVGRRGLAILTEDQQRSLAQLHLLMNATEGSTSGSAAGTTEGDKPAP